ncbi:sugar transferase [Prochlorococcus sp. AH-716-D22]|nr:sugar transferase [Prochlorococcus sp. AH-716-D22]
MADIILSILIIIFTLPLLIFFSIFIFVEDFGPILYFQKRVGKNGNTFTICKLRTMRTNAELKGAQWSKKEDIRITSIGKFLRSTRIDELPQLFSVLIGDMSLIGPRPERPEMDLILKEKIPFYDLRYLVKPGLSGWAQVNFPYGSSIQDSESKLTYDFFYIKKFSFWLDLLIFFKTIRLVSRREGALPLK